MCAVAAILPALIAGAGVVSAVGQIVAGNQAADAAKLKAQMDSASYLNKATAERQQANLEQVAGQYAARRQQIAADKLSSQQRVAFAASGVEIDSGSPLDVQIDSQQESALDQGITLFNANRKAQQFRGDAATAEGNARLATIGGNIAADNAQTNAMFGATTSLLTSAAGVGKTSFGRSLFS